MDSAIAGCFLFGVVGLFGLLGMAFVIDGLWKRYTIREGVCPNCRYDLTGIIARRRCPECGQGFQKLADVARYEYRRNYVELVVGLALLAAAVAFLMFVVPHL
jgi:hypothetical protein